MGSPVDVADREDVGDVGSLLSVGRDEALVVDLEACALGPDAVAVGAAPDRDQNTIVGLARGAAGVLQNRFETLVPRPEGADPGLESHRLVVSFDASRKRCDEVGVATGHERGHQLDHAHA